MHPTGALSGGVLTIPTAAFRLAGSSMSTTLENALLLATIDLSPRIVEQAKACAAPQTGLRYLAYPQAS